MVMALPLLVLSRAKVEANDGGPGDFTDGKNLLVTAEETIECRYVLPYYVVFEGRLIAGGIPFSYKFRTDLWGGCGKRANQMYLYVDSGTDYRPMSIAPVNL